MIDRHLRSLTNTGSALETAYNMIKDEGRPGHEKV